MAEETIGLDIDVNTSPLENSLNRSVQFMERFISRVLSLNAGQTMSATATAETYKAVAKEIQSVISIGEKLAAQQKKLDVQVAKNFSDSEKKKQEIRLAMFKDEKDKASARMKLEADISTRSKQLLDTVAARRKAFYEQERQLNIQAAREFEATERKKQELRLAMLRDERARSGGSGGGLIGGGGGSGGGGGQSVGFGGMLPALGSMGSMITGIYAGVQLIKQAWDQVAEAVMFVGKQLLDGVKYIELMKTSELGFAGLLYQMTDIFEGQRKVTDETERWTGSLEVASRITEALQDAALKTRATFTDLARGMQEGFGPMLQAGIGEEQITPFLTRFVHVMAALRIPIREIGQEMRAFFGGQSDPRTARVGFAMITQASKEMGISFEDAKKKLRELYASGQLDDWFMKSTQGLGKAGVESMNTLGGIFSNLKELIERALGSGTIDLYNQLRSSVEGLVDSLVTFDSKGKATFNENFIMLIKGAADAFSSVVDAVATLIIKFIEPGGLIDVTRMWIAEMQQSMMPDWLKSVLGGTWNAAKSTGSAIWGGAKAAGSWAYQESLDAGDPIAYALRGAMNGAKSWFSPRNGVAPAGMLDARGISRATNMDKYRYSPNVPEFATLDYEGDVGTDMVKMFKEAKSKEEQAKREQIERWKEWYKFQSDLTVKYSMEQWNFDKKLENDVANLLGKPGTILWQSEEMRKKRAAVDARGGIDKEEYEKAGGEELAKSFLKYIQNQQRALQEAFSRPLSSLFYGLATDGAKGFAEAAANEFNRLISTGADSLAGLLSNFVSNIGGNLTTDNAGNYILNGENIPVEQGEALKAKQAKYRQYAGNAMTFANIGIGSYANAQQNYSGAITTGALGGLMAGASTGNIYAAIAGLIVGYVGAALGKAEARENYKFATPGVNREGRAWLRGAKNINPQEQEQMLQDIQTTFDEVWNGFVRLALRVKADIPKFQGLEGFVQKEASANFMKHFQAWLTDELPKELMGEFEEGLQAAYVNMGMSAERFQEIWDKFGSMDARKALEILTLVAETLENFTKYMNTARDFEGEEFANTGFNRMRGLLQIEDSKTYARQFYDADQDIIRLGESIASLTGEDQIRQANELSRLLAERAQKQEELARQFNSFLDDSAKSFDALRRELTLEGMTTAEGSPDYAGQMEYLRGYLQEIMHNIASATNLEQLQYWQNEFFSTTNQMRGVAGQMGPDASAAFREWLMGVNGEGGVLDMFQSAIEGTVARWGEDLARRNNDLFGQIQPIINQFTQGMVNAGNSAGGAAGAIDRLPGPINRTVEALNDLEPAIRNLEARITSASRPQGSQSASISSNATDNSFEGRTVANRLKASGEDIMSRIRGVR